MDYNSPENQRIISEFVRQNVIQNVNSLIIAQPYDIDDGQWENELMSLQCGKEEWQESCEYYIGDDMTIRDCMEWLTGDNGEMLSGGNAKAQLKKYLKDEDKHQEFGEEMNLEPTRVDVYEHYSITEYLGRKLKEHGEVVEEYFNMTVWGRTCTGQAVMMDYVMGQICEDEKILEGQELEWKNC